MIILFIPIDVIIWSKFEKVPDYLYNTIVTDTYIKLYTIQPKSIGFS